MIVNCLSSLVLECLMKQRGFEFIHTPENFYDRGVSRTNILEAKLVAEYVKEHVEKHPDLSIGVVAFSMAQKEAILFEVEFMRRSNPSLEDFFNQEGFDEPFFVKKFRECSRRMKGM